MRVGKGFFNLEEFEAVEDQVGAPLRFTVQFTGRKSQQDMNGSAFGLLASKEADLPSVSDRLELSITIPLGFGTANSNSIDGRVVIRSDLEAVAAGTYDDSYRRVAARLIDAGYDDAIIRLGHEFNGAWPPWSSRLNEDAYIAAYRHVHDVLREASADFRFDWTSMRVGWEEWAISAYPGDDYVDIVGLDIYWKRKPNQIPWNPDAWERDYLPVLVSHHAFAEAHGKLVSYPEWGVAGADAPQFIEAMHEWLAILPDDGPGGLAYHAYFNTGGTYALDQYPSSERAFVELFGSS